MVIFRIAILALATSFCACGPIEVDARGAGAPSGAATAVTAPTGQTADPTIDGPATPSVVAPSAARTPGTSGILKGCSAADMSPVYGTNNYDWEDAKKSAPEGHHLATRAELFALIDGGFFKPGDNVVLWTSIPNSDTEAFAVSTVLKSSMSASKQTPFSAIYIHD